MDDLHQPIDDELESMTVTEQRAYYDRMLIKPIKQKEMRTSFRGIIQKIGKIKKLKNSGRMIEIIVLKPGFHDGEEQISRDQYYPIGVYNHHIEKIKEFQVNDKVNVVVYVNSRSVNTDDGPGYEVHLNLRDIEPANIQ